MIRNKTIELALLLATDKILIKFRAVCKTKKTMMTRKTWVV